MQAIEERSAGRWSPSPGSVYPALSQLEDEGLIRSVERDGVKLFELTDAGTAHVDEQKDRPAPWDDEDDAQGDASRELWSLVPQVIMAAKQVQHAGDERQLERARAVLSDARRALYRILADEGDE
jgi:DNA-binding PadR family transcriptional regulator